MAKPHLSESKDELDMTPMIDLVFLLIIFFILAGKISNQQRTEQITVPPTRTATKFESKLERVIINVFGTTKSGDPPRNRIRVGTTEWRASGIDDYSAYSKLRALLDRKYLEADKKPDVKNPALQIPQVIIEIRADADTEYRVVQEVLQVVTDSVDPDKGMIPNAVAPASMMPFININYTTRLPADKN